MAAASADILRLQDVVHEKKRLLDLAQHAYDVAREALRTAKKGMIRVRLEIEPLDDADFSKASLDHINRLNGEAGSAIAMLRAEFSRRLLAQGISVTEDGAAPLALCIAFLGTDHAMWVGPREQAKLAVRLEKHFLARKAQHTTDGFVPLALILYRCDGKMNRPDWTINGVRGPMLKQLGQQLQYEAVTYDSQLGFSDADWLQKNDGAFRRTTERVAAHVAVYDDGRQRRDLVHGVVGNDVDALVRGYADIPDGDRYEPRGVDAFSG